MPSERLYDIALQYKKTKLWKQLLDSELFALKLSNGEIGYCSVMGDLGEHIALGLYIGSAALDSYRLLFEAEDVHSRIARHEMLLSQNCLQCSFENKDELSPGEIEEAQKYAKAHGIAFRGQKAFPQFKRYTPAHYPWFLKDETDAQLLYEAISAAVWVAELLKTTTKDSAGFQPGMPYHRAIPFIEEGKGGYKLSTIDLPDRQEENFPTALVRDELLLSALKKKKKSSSAWECEVILLPSPIDGDGGDGGDDGDDGRQIAMPVNAPYFPYMLLTINGTSGMIIPGEAVPDYEKNAEKLVTDLMRSMREHGVPSEIRVRDKRTAALLGGIAEQVGIKLVIRDELPLLDEAEEDLFDHFSEDGDQSPDMAGEIFEMIMQMDDKTLRTMPEEMRVQLFELDRQGLLPETVSVRLRKLW